MKQTPAKGSIMSIPETPINSIRLMISDPRLFESYSIVEVATIAAGCEGESPIHKVYAALELLVAAQNAAMMTKRQLLAESESLLHNGEKTPTLRMFDRIHDTQSHHTFHINKKRLIESILAASDRDETTGQIKRTSLVIESLKALKLSHGGKHAETIYSEFCGNPSIPDLSDQYKNEWREEIKAAQMGLKTKIFKTEHAAEIFAIRLVGWLQDRKPHSPSKTARKDKGKLQKDDQSARPSSKTGKSSRKKEPRAQ